MSLRLRAAARRGGVALLLTAGLVAGLAGCGLAGHGSGAGGGTTNGAASGTAGGSAARGGSATGSASGGTGAGAGGSSGASSSPAATDVDGLQQAVDQAGSLADQVDQDMAGDASS
ncbi:hypothetical protein [Cellulomonas sp. 73-145]|uniref:hypothetical protein n=1 Tax=Cellulomonas sp. 73-145 TaxID=1895739 RepID=UPI001ACCB9B4|nr:hypothetical protein [Cellulomonas sp. 73-145]MBN9328009.1 hypothetical protein [Cellulomonas sp.]